MVAWFTVVVEAYMYNMTTISLLFPHSGKRKRGRRKQGNCIQLAPHTNISHVARVTNLFLVTCNKLQWMGVQSYVATNYCACMFPGAQGRGLGQPPGKPPALQLVGGLSCLPLTSSAGQ